MGNARPRLITTVAAIAWLGAASASTEAPAAPAAAIRADTHRLAVDVRREAHAVGQDAAGQADQLHRRLLTARAQVSLQLRHLSNRFHHWWNRVKPG